MSRNSGVLTLRRVPQREYGVYCLLPFSQGDTILTFDGEVLPAEISNPMKAIQINEHFGWEYNKGSYEDYLNHSCNPNCWIKFVDGVPTLIARRDIKNDEELCYNYNTVAYDLEKGWRSFPCHCHESNCIGWIRGFLYLTPAQEKEIENMLSPYMLEMMREHEKNRD